MLTVVLTLIALLLLPVTAVAQGPSCEDRLREVLVHRDYLAVSKHRDLGEAMRAIAEQAKLIEALKAEVERLRSNLPAGQTGGSGG